MRLCIIVLGCGMIWDIGMIVLATRCVAWPGEGVQVISPFSTFLEAAEPFVVVLL